MPGHATRNSAFFLLTFGLPCVFARLQEERQRLRIAWLPCDDLQTVTVWPAQAMTGEACGVGHLHAPCRSIDWFVLCCVDERTIPAPMLIVCELSLQSDRARV